MSARIASLALTLLLAVASGCGRAGADGPTPPAANPPGAQAARADAASAVGQAVVGDWPRFLGPHGTGVSDETGLADAWPVTGPPVLWSKKVGAGYSAPSVLGDRLVVHHRIGDEEVIECLDAATGESRWRHGTPTDFVDPYGYNGGPRATPLLADGRCYTLGAAGTLCCVDLATGNEVWRRETSQDFTVPEGFFGVGGSPVLYGDLVIAFVGGQPDSGVVAFDKRTGATVWHAVGKPTWDGVPADRGEPYRWTGDETVVSYASPTLATFHGRDHLLCLVRHGLVSLDPQTGGERFRYWFRSPLHESVNAATPVVVGNRVLITAAYRTGAALLEVTPEGGVSEVWRDRDNLECHWSTPIVADGLAYGFSGRHESEAALKCVDLATGEVVWEADGTEPVHGRVKPDVRGRRYIDATTGEPAAWPYFGRGSKIAADGKFVLLGERGTLHLGDLSREGYRERSRTGVEGIGYPAWAAPVLSRGRLYLRDEDTLVCLDVSKRVE